MPHPKRSFRSFNPIIFFILFLSAFLTAAQRFSAPKPSHDVEIAAERGVYADIGVAYIYDGDTIKLTNGEKVRLVGIDTPESIRSKKLFRDAARSGRKIKDILAVGHLAAAYTRSLLDGRRVRLEFDIEKRDKYGRLLAYVYRVDDGLFINEDIVRNGYAYPKAIAPNIRYADEFKRLFREAQKAERGLWSHTM